MKQWMMNEHHAIHMRINMYIHIYIYIYIYIYTYMILGGYINEHTLTYMTFETCTSNK